MAAPLRIQEAGHAWNTTQTGTISITPAAGASRKLVLFGLNTAGTPGADSATFNGIALTRVNRVTGGNFHITLFYMDEAAIPAGGPFDLIYDRANAGGQGRMMMGLYSGAKQGAFDVDTPFTPFTTATDPWTVDLTTVTAESMVLIAAYGANTNPTSEGAGQVRVITQSSNDRNVMSQEERASAGLDTYSYTFGATKTGLIRAVALAPAAGGGGGGGLPHVAVLNALL